MNEKKLWKPVRIGTIYCSPACGGECRWSAFQRATENAGALCAHLGAGWTPRVWENFGWHYEAVKGDMQVHPDQRSNYKREYGPRWTARVGGTIYYNTPVQSFCVRYKGSPHAGVKAALDEARGAVRILKSAIERVTS